MLPIQQARSTAVRMCVVYFSVMLVLSHRSNCQHVHTIHCRIFAGMLVFERTHGCPRSHRTHGRHARVQSSLRPQLGRVVIRQNSRQPSNTNASSSHSMKLIGRDEKKKKANLMVAPPFKLWSRCRNTVREPTHNNNFGERLQATPRHGQRR